MGLFGNFELPVDETCVLERDSSPKPLGNVGDPR